MPAGFVGRKTGAPRPNPPMTIDPNADLVGYAFPLDGGGEGVVVGTNGWLPLYVDVRTPTGLTMRVAGQVRRRKELAG